MMCLNSEGVLVVVVMERFLDLGVSQEVQIGILLCRFVILLMLTADNTKVSLEGGGKGDAVSRACNRAL